MLTSPAPASIIFTISVSLPPRRIDNLSKSASSFFRCLIGWLSMIFPPRSSRSASSFARQTVLIARNERFSSLTCIKRVIAGLYRLPIEEDDAP